MEKSIVIVGSCFSLFIFSVAVILMWCGRTSPSQAKPVIRNGWKFEVQSQTYLNGERLRVIELTGEGSRYDFFQVGDTAPMFFQSEPESFPHK